MSASSPRRKTSRRRLRAEGPGESPAAGRAAAHAPPADPSDEKPLRYIIQNLERFYGVPENEHASDPLDMLVAVIRGLLRQIRERHGTLDLSFLHGLPAAEAPRYLSGFRGVGPKTAPCTLLFACRKDVFPLDTHIFRVLRRVGLVPERCTDRRAHELMTRAVPAGKFYSLHVNLIRHGRRLCRPRDTLCERCSIVEYCDYGQGRI